MSDLGYFQQKKNKMQLLRECLVCTHFSITFISDIRQSLSQNKMFSNIIKISESKKSSWKVYAMKLKNLPNAQ